MYKTRRNVLKFLKMTHVERPEVAPGPNQPTGCPSGKLILKLAHEKGDQDSP